MIGNKLQDLETTQGGTYGETCQKGESTHATENFEAEQSGISSTGIGPATVHEGTPTVCIAPMTTWEGIPSVCEGTLTHAVGGSEISVFQAEGIPTKFEGCGHAVGGLD